MKTLNKHTFLPLAALASISPAIAADVTRQPNIIMFLVDDMGWQDTSVPFWSDTTALNRRYRTPNMERLAERGVKFTQAYACAVSSPSRASLMSGMNAARHRVTNWTLHYNRSTDMEGGELDMPDWNVNGIQPAATATPHDTVRAAVITPFPELLRDAGYRTIHCGKAHFGAEGTSAADPLTMGFDVNIAGGANGAPASYLAEYEYGSGPFHVSGLEKYYGTGIFLTEALTLEAIKAMGDAVDADKPFYLYMSQYAIHTPYNPDSRFTPNYSDTVDPVFGEKLTEAEINHAALIEGMDKSLGDIMDWLDANPDVAANTVLLFMSDNGGHSIWPRQGRIDRDQNLPARAGKGSALEGGIHEPMLVSWPGVAQPGTVNTSRVMIEDFYPTILDIAGVHDYNTVQTIDGISFKDLIGAPSVSRDRTIVWHFPNRWDGTVDESEGYGAYSALMRGDYHLIYFWESGNIELYNVVDDIGETVNLAAIEPATAASMAEELTRRLKEMDAQRPTFKANGQLVPWPSERHLAKP